MLLKRGAFVNEEKPARSYEVNWNASNLSNRVYFYQLRAGDPSSSSVRGFVEANKMQLFK